MELLREGPRRRVFRRCEATDVGCLIAYKPKKKFKNVVPVLGAIVHAAHIGDFVI